ncbi:hypothetical protein [Scytonema sp. PRP1]|uniref:hypothetical protein n=1 Tax=Scytonema sp. PRP1 TaxID=3120513 RepID=UPI00300C3355
MALHDSNLSIALIAKTGRQKPGAADGWRTGGYTLCLSRFSPHHRQFCLTRVFERQRSPGRPLLIPILSDLTLSTAGKAITLRFLFYSTIKNQSFNASVSFVSA